jgi:hypothetical protein
LNRAGFYYKPVPVSPHQLAILHRIDELYTLNPAWGSATIGTILRREGLSVNDPTVRRCMTEMGLCAVYPGPNPSKRMRESLINPKTDSLISFDRAGVLNKSPVNAADRFVSAALRPLLAPNSTI